MFKTGKNFEYASLEEIKSTDYRIAPDDLINFAIYTNEGVKLVDITNSTTGGGVATATPFRVESDGFIKLPVIDRIQIAGYTTREAEKLLQEKYSVYYNEPFVILEVINKRVYIFPGSGSTGRVLELRNENTSVVEALAEAGGIYSTGKAHRIKLIRGQKDNPVVYLIDLSTIEGMKKGNITLQANDIIYVEPVQRVSESLLAEITPYVTILTKVLLIINLVNR
jgi:polysaccharide biosynthesis/export protein